jgi:plasmid stability protein
MKQITIRSIPDGVKKTVQKEAERKGVSLNKAVLSLLERAARTKAPDKKKKALHYDLDHLAGLWSREEAAEFDRYLKAQRSVVMFKTRKLLTLITRRTRP